MADLLNFLFKSKFIIKLPSLISICSINLLLYSIIVSCSKECSLDANNQICEHGECNEDFCECHPGWAGKYCQFCSGRVRLWNESGIITDGAGNYTVDNQCTWLINPNRNNSHIRLYLDHFATECSWDHLYIYDGGSVYDPLLAVFSGMIVQEHYQASRTPEVVAKSGKALLYFYSDAAGNLPGFSISYRLNGCSSSASGEECSGHGVCIDGECTCNAQWTGVDCTLPLCPSNCHGNGECNMEEHRCLCHEGYTGNDCKQKTEIGWWESFPQAMNNPLLLSSLSYQSYSQLERASHCSVILNDEIWVVGGYSFVPKAFLLTINVTDGSLRTVESASKEKPTLRHGHSCVTYNGSLYVFGGATGEGGATESKELWMFDLGTQSWTLLEPSLGCRAGQDNGKGTRNSHSPLENVPSDPRKEGKVDHNASLGTKGDEKDAGSSAFMDDFMSGSCLGSSGSGGAECTPVATTGHTAVVVEEVMLIIFGHSAIYGDLNLVQEFHFRYGRWRKLETGGAVVEGTYGHTAVWDPTTTLVYVHGGLQSAAPTQVLSRLLAFDPFKHVWFLKQPAPLPRFLHSASLLPGLLLVFGGNTHNGAAFSYGTKCFSADFLLYDIQCDKWHKLDNPPNLQVDTARYGHTAISTKDRMVVIGGFNGRMLGTTLHYHPGSCDVVTSKDECLVTYPGKKCVWNRVLERCESLLQQNQMGHDFCSALKQADEALNLTALCTSQTSCHSCLYNSYGCVWCNNRCSYEKCAGYTKGIVSSEGCEDRRRWWCKSLKSCNLCNAFKGACNWLSKECIFAPNQTSATAVGRVRTPSSGDGGVVKVEGDMLMPMTPINASSSTFAPQATNHTCVTACSQRVTCANCTEGHCMWCFNQQRCVPSNSYRVSFPYGQCREWTIEPRRCSHLEKGISRCMVHQTCKRCQEDIGCGWCDAGTGTGTGVCLEGGQSGPVNASTTALDVSKCELEQWFFTSCPECNCNGHSYCMNDTVCVQPCANNTQGPHCDTCKDSFFGKPINGGLCKPCQCNGHGITCEADTGVCHCHTKGVTGDHCERCDTLNNYYGEPLNGSCFYDLQINYQFTFNLSKQEHTHIRQINFLNVPSKSYVDTDFDIQCSKPARIKISARQTGGDETFIVKNFTGMSIKRRFSASEYTFGSGENNTTFYIYVFNFTLPIEIIISFSQHPKLSLPQFFSSIFSL